MIGRTAEDVFEDYANARVNVFGTKSLIEAIKVLLKGQENHLEAENQDLEMFQKELVDLGQEVPETLPSEWVENLRQIIVGEFDDQLNDGQMDDLVEIGMSQNIL